MSDSLGDGRGGPTEPQCRLYEHWAQGGVALSIVGEVQGSPRYPEKAGNLVLSSASDPHRFRELARRGGHHNSQLWLQLGHAGAMADAPISAARGPSALDLPGLTCAALSLDEIARIPAEFAQTAARAKRLGFGGVELHAAHGFLLSQFLSPLFNRRGDAYGGNLQNRMRLLHETIAELRAAVGPSFPVGLKLNATDQIEGGFEAEEALAVLATLGRDMIDLVDISGGTYFPGAKSASDSTVTGPYFLGFAERARAVTQIPLMVTGGFKTRQQAEGAIASGAADMVGLARALIVDPFLPRKWLAGEGDAPAFPRFSNPPEGGVTAWYTMQMTQIATGADPLSPDDLARAIRAYEARDEDRRRTWIEEFGPPATASR